eukprot:359433-Chlamydomonas_euryale.AAC.5
MQAAWLHLAVFNKAVPGYRPDAHGVYVLLTRWLFGGVGEVGSFCVGGRAQRHTCGVAVAYSKSGGVPGGV